jgi:hypothetical protein
MLTLYFQLDKGIPKISVSNLICYSEKKGTIRANKCLYRTLACHVC